MGTLTEADEKMASPMPNNLAATLAHHDAAINTLGGRMTGVESSVRTLQGEVHTGFSALGSKLDKLDAAPKFDFHQTTKTVLSLSVLFSMVCAGIIYITNAQSAAERAKQEALNGLLTEKVSKTESILEKIDNKLDWAPIVERRK
jgi:hypothetical protein